MILIVFNGLKTCVGSLNAVVMDPIGSHEVDKPNVDENPNVEVKDDSSSVVVRVDVTEAFTTDKVSF
jgi:hypothetical protein